MAPTMALQDDDNGDPPDISLEEIIFSCEICQATVSEVYATKENHEGFHSGSSSESSNGIVTKMWIGACSHVFCGKHLQGGGVAFHPKDVAPTAGCPVCPKTLPSSRDQELFAIRGLKPGEYDNIIPDSWLCCPPTRLDADDVEMDALRFQYQHLARYSRKVNKAWKIADSKRRIMEIKLASERNQWRKRDAETKEALNERDAIIEDRDAKLKRWDSRKDVINHYMGIVGPMAKDIADMRALLVKLNYQVPDRDYSYQPKSKTKPMIDERTQQNDRHDSSATLVESNIRTSSTTKKRKATNDAYADSQEQGLEEPHPQPSDDRALMMPPPLPKLRPPRQPDPCARGPQQPDFSERNATQSRQQFFYPPGQQPRVSQQHSTRDAQQIVPQPREQSSRYTQQATIQYHSQPPYASDERVSPSQSSVQMYGSRGWQDQPPPSAAPSIRSGVSALSRTQNIQPPAVQQGLPYREAQQLVGSRRSSRPTGYDQQPSRAPLAQPLPRQQEQFAPPSRPSFYQSGGWRGVTSSAPTGGGYEPRSSQLQPAQSQPDGRTRFGLPPYRQPRQVYAGHNGTTTLSSEFRAQERSTTKQRQTGLSSQPAKRRIAQEMPFSTAGSNAYVEVQPHAPSEISYYDPGYGTMAQQSGENAPREMEGFHMPPPPALATTRAPLNGGGQYRLTTPAHRKHLEPPAASSVAGPFFGQPSRRQPEAVQRENRERFSYARPASSTRGNVAGRYQRNDGMPPPTSSYGRNNRTIPSRNAFVPSRNAFPGTDNSHESASVYAGGSQQSYTASRTRPSQTAGPRERVSLPSVARLSHRNDGRGDETAPGSSYDPQSIFSGAGPTRRSVRR